MVYSIRKKQDSTIDLYSIMIYLTILQIILTIITIDDFKYKTFDIIITFFNTIVLKGINIFIK